MALSARNKAASLASQPGSVFVAPSGSDYHVCAEMSLDMSPVTVDNPEFTGSIYRPGPEIIGKTVQLRLRYLLRPPGGTAPPAANAWVPGRALVSAGFTETIISTAIPPSPEPLAGTGTSTSASLSTGAVATADAYTGLSINLVANGVYPASLSAIKAYEASKLATFPETFSPSVGGNYQIPRQIAYLMSSNKPTQKYMSRVHFDEVAYDLFNMIPRQISLGYSTADLNNQSLTYIEVTYEAEMAGYSDMATPAQVMLAGLPLYRCGDQWLANRSLGGTGFTVTIDFTTERPPNPNTCIGDPPEITDGRFTVSVNVNHALKSTVDFFQFAEVDKGYYSLWAQFGQASGSIASLLIPRARFNIPQLGENGTFVAQNLDMMIDNPTRGVCIAFPY